MRILHLCASHRWTGAAEPAARQAAAQTRLGHDVHFAVTAGHSLDREARALGVSVVGDVPFDRTLWPQRRLADLRLLRGVIASLAPDIVHAHLTHDHILAALAIGARGARKPVLVRTWHREAKPRRDPFARYFASRTVGAVAVSRELADQLRRTYGFPESRIAVARGAVDCTRFFPSDRGAAMRARWGVPLDAPVAGIISRLRVARGIEWLLDSAEEFLQSVPTAWLVICGRGNWQEEMKARIASHPHRARIVHAGYVSGTDLEDSYNAFDVGLLLRPGNDGACRGALEAMACGKPVVAGDIGALRDLVGGTERGWLVPDMDRRALGDALAAALRELDETRRRGAIAQRDVAALYGEESLAAEMVRFYGALITAT